MTVRSNSNAAVQEPSGPAAGGVMQRKCGCGSHTPAAGACSACSGRQSQRSPGTTLPVGPADDRYEREADRISAQVMRKRLRDDRDPAAAPLGPVRGISRLGGGVAGRSPVPGMLGTRGQALDGGTREMMEGRFGHDFSAVRVHTGTTASRSAQTLGARAYTVGQHIVFGSGEFAPGTKAGQHLLAHELTHTIQQGAGGRRFQRLVEIQPDSAAATDILGQFNSLCANGNFSVDQNNRMGADCRESSPVCDCLCDVVTDPDTPYVIEVHNVANNPTSVTLHDGSTETIPMPSVGPNTDRSGGSPTVHMASTTGSSLVFGAFQPDGSPFLYGNPRILIHELCSHARLGHSYAGTKGDRPGHDVTIQTENALGGPPARGLFADPRQGESFHQLPASDAPKAFKQVDGWHFERIP
jgi:hypothetical protein